MGSKPERMLTAALVSGSTREQDELVLAFLMTNHSNTGAGYFFFNCRCFCYPWLPRMEKAAPPLLFTTSPGGLQAVGQCCAGSRGAGQQ